MSYRHAFLQSISCAFMFAFGSLYVQIPGLYGDNGILPASAKLQDSVPKTLEEFSRQPSFVRFASQFGLSVEEGMDLCCLIGLLFSVLTALFRNFRTTASYLVMWLMYLSVYELGQTFLWFQWDILLLEVGFLSVLIADVGFIGPYGLLPAFPRSSISMLLVRWLLFRLLFASGVVKLNSRCPTWWGLTALNYHYESQCIPTPLAWYAHQMPDWFQKFSVASTFFIQIFLTFFFFCPFTSLVHLALLSQVFLQVLILLTGNYNFFNALTIFMCLALADGGKVFHKFLALFVPKAVYSATKSAINLLGVVCGFGVIGWVAVKYFSVHVVSWYPPVVFSKIAFTESEFNKFVDSAVPFSILLTGSVMVIAIVNSLAKAVFSSSSLITLPFRVAGTAFYAVMTLSLFAISCVPFCRGLHRPLPQPLIDAGASQMYQHITHDLNLPVATSYGLFRRMTGVGGRPEIVIEAAMSQDGPWQPYEFLYKPGNVNKMPPFVAPHQPRLDWQMWFAALSSAGQDPWFISFCDRLLNSEPTVMQLIEKAPFEGKRPLFIRAKLYHYHYSSNFTGKNWWRREFKHEYLPPVKRGDLNRHIAHMRVPGYPARKHLTLTAKFVQACRRAMGQPEGFKFLSAMFFGVVATYFMLDKAKQ